MKHYIFYLLCIITIFSSCKKDDEASSVIDTFHEEYYDVNILPALSKFKTEIEEQIALSEIFKTNRTLDNFNNLQDQWLKSAKAFSKTRVYNLVAVKTLFFDVIIYNYPANPTLIEEHIAEKAVYDTDYISSKNTVSKGLAALEYLIYNNQDTATALTLMQDDAYRVDYLLGVTQEILRQTNLLITFWEEDYKEEFINAKSISCTENARCLAFNQIINILDVIRVTKVGKPAGLDSSSSATVESLEAYRSENSLELIRSIIEEVEYAYTSSTVNFSDIVDDIAGSSQISDEINNTFNDVYNHIDAIETSLYIAIDNDNPNVELLYNTLFDLVKYFSVDAASILSVSVLPTDNDGD